MIYGDNPVKWNEREPDKKDPLGLNTYTYKPDITAIMQSSNLYAYCMGNPLMFIDPNGELVVAVVGGVSITLGAVIAAGLSVALLVDLVFFEGAGYQAFLYGVHQLGMGVADALKSSVYLAQNKNKTVTEILKTKLGSIKNAPLPSGSPSWEEIASLTLAEIQRRAQRGEVGFKTFYKLLTQAEYNR